MPVAKVGNFNESVKIRQKQREEDQLRINEEVKKLTSIKDKIISRFLRKTTLNQGETVKGIIQFKLKSGWLKPNAVVLLKNNSIKEAANTIPYVIEYK